MMYCYAPSFFDDDAETPFPWSDNMGGSNAPAYDPNDDFYGGPCEDPYPDPVCDSIIAKLPKGPVGLLIDCAFDPASLDALIPFKAFSPNSRITLDCSGGIGTFRCA